jgi:hypothetical protein
MTVLTRSLQVEYGAAGVSFSVCFRRRSATPASSRTPATARPGRGSRSCSPPLRANAFVKGMSAAVMFLGKEQRIRSAADAGLSVRSTS